ncbi:MAG: helix-turn-helix domain-containing protein [Mycobacterium sp.]|uniref:TetR/AcrR family transcriptional regulator n=1 Tax=Mycobacterium sp. TaxID=1785 RepID=UPI003CC57ADB
MTTRVSTSKRQDAPLGREEVAAAILTAAAELFAEHGPAATSIRDIAARSKVNHGLVFRHFGTKEQLVGAVLDHLGAKMTELLAGGVPAEQIEAAADQQLRVMARTLLDGYPAGQLQKRFPNVAALFEQVRPRHDSDAGARLAVANALALQFGWRLFEPILRSAAGIDELPTTDLRRAVGEEMARILQPR